MPCFSAFKLNATLEEADTRIMHNSYLSKGHVKLAYLILTHQFPALLARLIDKLDGPTAHFFIHVDGKTDMQPFVRAVKPAENVHFTDVRSKVHWRGFSMVEATLQLMKEAIAHEKGFDYCIFLSGADYPIKTRHHIQRFFENTTYEYIHYARLQDCPTWMKTWMPRIQQYFFNDAIPYDRYRRTLRLMRLLRRKAFSLASGIFPRKFLKGVEPYGGSSWFNITGECVAYLVDYVRQHPHFVRYYRYCDSPDEMFFQTIILNSPFAERTVHYNEYCQLTEIDNVDERWAERERKLPAESFHLRYIDFSCGGGSPAVLAEKDFAALKSSEALWARKMHPIISAQLLDMIDFHLLREGT